MNFIIRNVFCNMKNALVIVVALLFINSCQDNETNRFSKPIAKTVTDFYTWYLDGYYNNEKNIELSFVNSDGISSLDTFVYFNKIRESGFFSEEYINNRKIQIESCLLEINKLDWGVVKNYDGNPAELIKGIECNFLMAYNFLFHQGETVKDVEVEVIMLDTEDVNKVVVVAEQLIEKDGKSNGFKMLVTLVKEDKWKITDISSAN